MHELQRAQISRISGCLIPYFYSLIKSGHLIRHPASCCRNSRPFFYFSIYYFSRLIKLGLSGTLNWRNRLKFFLSSNQWLPLFGHYMPGGMGGVGHAGAGGGAAGGVAADDELHRRELCLGWIYEFFARHRMEEAQEGAFAGPLARRFSFVAPAAYTGVDAVIGPHPSGRGGGNGASPFCARAPWRAGRALPAVPGAALELG